MHAQILRIPTIRTFSSEPRFSPINFLFQKVFTSTKFYFRQVFYSKISPQSFFQFFRSKVSFKICCKLLRNFFLGIKACFKIFLQSSALKFVLKFLSKFYFNVCKNNFGILC